MVLRMDTVLSSDDVRGRRCWHDDCVTMSELPVSREWHSRFSLDSRHGCLNITQQWFVMTLVSNERWLAALVAHLPLSGALRIGIFVSHSEMSIERRRFHVPDVRADPCCTRSEGTSASQSTAAFDAASR